MENINLSETPENGINPSKPEPTDAQRLIRQHIADPTHEITDEDIRNVKLTPTDQPPVIGAEALARLEDIDDEEISGDGRSENDDIEIRTDEAYEHKKHTTPWDIASE